jgi:predicted ATP-grasp superfamily ATP-dependent carboligase
MRVGVWEYFCSGASHIGEADKTIQREGMAMLLALVSDLREIPVDIEVLWDPSLGQFSRDDVTVHETQPDTFDNQMSNVVSQSDRVIVIAPESDSILLNMHTSVAALSEAWCGLNAKTIALCSDKLATYQTLSRSRVPTVPTTPLDADASVEIWPCVIKPQFGAGCDDTFVVRSQNELSALNRSVQMHPFIVQPFINGRSRSVAGVGTDGQWQILPCVDQAIAGNQSLSYEGGTLDLTSEAEGDSRITDLFHACVNAIEAANGWLGIDFIEEPNGAMHVVDINPRLTTSYVAYQAACRQNLAASLLGISQSLTWRPGRYSFSKNGGVTRTRN